MAPLQDLVLSFTESNNPESLYTCNPIRFVSYKTRSDLLLVSIIPTINGARFNLENSEISYFVLQIRLSGYSFLGEKWPIPVHIAYPKVDFPRDYYRFTNDEIILLAWGEVDRKQD